MCKFLHLERDQALWNQVYFGHVISYHINVDIVDAM